jgi:hypothetical protein
VDDTGWQPRPEISFIQVCRNYLRFGAEDMLDEQVLADMYEGGTAYYYPPGTDTMDIFASIRYVDRDGKFRFAPLILQVKSIKESIKEQIQTGLEGMTKFVEDAKYDTGLALVIRLGAETDEMTSSDRKLEGKHIDGIGREIVSKLLVIPKNDAFGVTSAFTSVTADSEEVSELISSHRAITSHAWSVKGKRRDMTTALRSKGRKKLADDVPQQFLWNVTKSLWEADESIEGRKEPTEPS